MGMGRDMSIFLEIIGSAFRQTGWLSTRLVRNQPAAVLGRRVVEALCHPVLPARTNALAVRKVEDWALFFFPRGLSGEFSKDADLRDVPT